MTTIASVAVKLAGDPAQLFKDARKAASDSGDEAGKTFSQRFSGAAGKLAFAGLAAGAAIAVKGLGDLDKATQDYRATTGATQADINKMQATVLDLNRHNLDNIDQITGVLAVLRTDMGLTQDEADALAQSFLSYAKVTQQDDVGAVKAFDDILDAWGLKASDSAGIMDKLVASHQKYGGSIEENQQALATLAPQLKALNVDVDGAIGLLNLFAASGIDSSKATAALNTAVAKLKPGQSLDDLIAKISAIEDPTQRAKEAIDVFGARGGVALANALKPGVTSLKDFEVGAGDASGAVKKASDQIDSSLENSVKLAIKDYGGAFVQLMAQGGPVLQFTAIGGPAILGAIRLIDGALTATSLTAGIRWAAILGPLGAAGIAVLGLAALKQQVDAVNESQRQAAAAAGDQAAVQAQLNGQVKQSADDWTQYDIAMDKSLGTQELQQQLAADTTTAVTDQGTAVVAMANATRVAADIAAKVAGDMATGWKAGTSAVVQSGTDMDDALLGQFKGVQEQARFAGEHVPRSFAEGITTTRQEPLDAFTKLVEMLKHPMSETAETARLIGELTGKQLAKGLLSADPDIRNQARATRNTILDRLAEIQPGAGTVGKKAMDELAAGMKSKDPVIRGAALGIYETVRAGLALKDARLWAEHAANAYAEGFASRQEYLAEKTRVFLAGASRQMIAASPPKAGPLKDIDKWGQRTGLAWVDAFIAALETAEDRTKLTLKKVQTAIQTFIAGYSPIGGLFGGLTPEADRANLERYIAELRGELPKETDPAKRLEILQQIIEYQGRLDALQGDTATKSQRTAETIQGYVNRLDKALLTATDPKRIKALTDELLIWLTRLDKILHPTAKPAAAAAPDPAAAAALPAIDQTDPTVDANGDPTGHYEMQGNSLVWMPNVPMSSFSSGNPTPGTGGFPITVTVNNPAPEPASTSTKRELQLLAATGILG